VVELFFCEIGGGFQRFVNCGGIIKGAIEAPERLYGVRDQPLDVGGLGDIGENESRGASESFNLTNHSFAALSASGCNHNTCALTRKCDRRGSADSGTPPSDRARPCRLGVA